MPRTNKLPPDACEEIRRIYFSSRSMAELAEEYDVSPKTIWDIIQRIGGYEEGASPNTKIDRETADEIRQIYAASRTAVQLAEMYRVSRQTIGAILSGKGGYRRNKCRKAAASNGLTRPGTR